MTKINVYCKQPQVFPDYCKVIAISNEIYTLLVPNNKLKTFDLWLDTIEDNLTRVSGLYE